MIKNSVFKIDLNTGLVLTLASILFFSGCASAPPYTGQGPHPQITRGGAVPPVDFLGNILAVEGKLILWNRKFANHYISPETEAMVIEYIDSSRLPPIKDTKFRLNQYCPVGDLKALFKNRHVAWPYRLTLGLLTTLLYDVLLPGRLFPWGDYYNPYTNSVHLYSDDEAIALHEAGHAQDFADYSLRGTYALLRIVPFMDLYQEWRASDEAINFLIDKGKREEELRSYKILFPAYGTYAGSYLPIPFGSIAGAFVGHVSGRLKSGDKRRYYERMDVVLETPQEWIREQSLSVPQPEVSLQKDEIPEVPLALKGK